MNSVHSVMVMMARRFSTKIELTRNTATGNLSIPIRFYYRIRELNFLHSGSPSETTAQDCTGGVSRGEVRQKMEKFPAMATKVARVSL